MWRGPRRVVWRGLRWALRLGLVAILAGALSAWAASAWMHRRAASRIHTSVADVPARTVGVVLGASVSRAGPSPIVEGRLASALALYRAGKVRKVLVSGDHGHPSYDEVNAMRAWLVAAGVPPRDVFLDHAGFRTLDTMERAARVFQVRDAVICTQRFHLPRALFLAGRAGIDAAGLAADGDAPGASWRDELRERVASVVALADVAIGRQPRHLGVAVPIDGDGRVTQDRPRPR